MPTRPPLAAAITILALTASVDVRSVTSPGANLGALHTFRVMQNAKPRSVTQYTQGTVIVDVVDPNTKELLWRGQGVAAVSDDEAQYEQDRLKTVTAILEKFPRAQQGS